MASPKVRCRGTLRCRRARRHRRRSRRSPSTASSPTATRARSWPRTARSTGCASRASTRPACSARCSTAARAASASARSGSTSPSDRIYEPGTNTIVTSWKTPTGWVVVRDALTMGPRRGEDTVTPHTRPPFDQDADHALVRTATCIDGTVEIDLVCEPAFDYGRVPGEWTLSADRHRAEATGGRAGAPAADRHARRHRGRAGSRPPRPARRRDGLLRARLERGRARPGHRRGGAGAARGHDEVLARLARARGDPRPRARAADPAVGADHQGPHVHADGGERRGAHHLAAGDTRRRAQLGLPLHLDPRLDLPAAGAALPAAGLGGRRVHAVHRRPRPQRGRRACRSCTGSTVAGT